jgi:hypothetical protein
VNVISKFDQQVFSNSPAGGLNIPASIWTQ